MILFEITGNRHSGSVRVDRGNDLCPAPFAYDSGYQLAVILCREAWGHRLSKAICEFVERDVVSRFDDLTWRLSASVVLDSIARVREQRSPTMISS